jgi:predicted ABC-type ATPase
MAMKEYNRRLVGMNADSIALMYDEEGELGDIATGRDSIASFLRKFQNVQVIRQGTVTDTIQFMHNRARHTGFYVQMDVFDKKDTVTVRGTFTTIWMWNERDGWRIKRMDTKPL